MKTLVIVDFQNDFCNPNGTLYVKGAEDAKTNLIKYLTENKDNIDNVILTRDWHNVYDHSFKQNGGIWPTHCVAGTWGAEIDKDIIEVLDEKGFNYMYSNKGTCPDVEEYGAFSTIYETDEGIIVQNVNDLYVTVISNTDLVVCGIAGDYCVKETVKNLKESGLFNIEVLVDCVASIDDGTTIKEFVNTL